MHRRLIAHLLPVLVTLLLWGCAPIQTPTPDDSQSDTNARAAGTTLNVFAAASLTDAFNQIGDGFSAAHPGVTVVNNFAGSNQLATQIASGAPVDVFASANPAQMDAVIASGRVTSGTARIFAHNRLVVIMPDDNPAALTTLEDLAKPGVKIVFAASEVPVGQYTLAFLDKAATDPSLGAGYEEAVLANVVSYEQNVRAVLAKVTLAEADAGIVYTSDVAAATDGVLQIEIPDRLNTIADYPIAPLHDSANGTLAQQFVEYVLSAAGQQVLADYGFIPATEQ